MKIDQIPGSPLTNRVRTVLSVKHLAPLASEGLFAGPGRLFRLWVEGCDALEFSTTVGVFWVILRLIANGLTGCLRFHVVDLLRKFRIVILTPFQLVAKDVKVSLARGNDQFNHSTRFLHHDAVPRFQLQSHLSIYRHMDLIQRRA